MYSEESSFLKERSKELLFFLGRLLRLKTLALLIDQVGVDCFDIRFGQQIVETFHPGGAERALQDDRLEGGMHGRRQFAQIRRDAWAENVAA